MNTHLKTILVILFFIGFGAAACYAPTLTLISIFMIFLYAVVYTEFKKFEKSKNGENETTGGNN